MTTQNQQLVALSSADLAPTQAQLADWCRRKILDLAKDLRRRALREMKP